MVRIFVPDVPEFSPLVEAARANTACRVKPHAASYLAIECAGPVEFRRKEMGLKPAIWYGLFTGGVEGVIEQFDRDVVRILPLTASA